MVIILSPAQQQIVNYQDGALLIIAGAGSGKTRVLTERVKRLVLKKDGNYRVLALTFSNKAAKEISDRLEDVEDIKDKAFIGTIHKFCMEVISSRGKVIGIDSEPHIFESLSDRINVLKQVFENIPNLKPKLINNPNPDKLLTNILDYIGNKKRNLIPPEDADFVSNLSDSEKFLAMVYKEYNDYLRSQNALEFDDILLFTYRIFTERPKIAEFYRNLFKYICIDEAQDLNYAQYHIIKSLCGNEFKNIMMVGDPNQAIYGFNGSSSDFMMKNFKKDFQPIEIKLNENYRSSLAIINSAKKLEPNFDIQGVLPIKGELKVISLPDEQTESQWVINKLNGLINNTHPDIEDKISWESCAILARNRYIFSFLEKLIIDNKMPYYYKKTNEFVESESDIMKIFELGLRIIINSRDDIHLRQLFEIIKIKYIKINSYDNGFDILKEINTKIDFQSQFYKTYPIILTGWEQLSLENPKFEDALRIIEEYTNIEIKDEETKFFILKDIEMWRKHWKKYLSQTVGGQRLLIQFRNQVSLGETQDHTESKGLALLTIHNSKGLEFDVTFIIGMNQGVFPDYRALQSGGKQLEEEHHNIFVAITRSKRLCYITFPRKKLMPWGTKKEQQPSQYIEEMGLHIDYQ
ncbi:MAG: ATP-dependent helicase [Candidatus Methanoperedens sp.]